MYLFDPQLELMDPSHWGYFAKSNHHQIQIETVLEFISIKKDI